jgi:hypothetical protein
MAIPRWRRTVAPLGALIALVATATAVASSSPPAGSVHQASGKAGCYTSDGSSEAGPGTCHNIRGGDGSTTVALSPDGHFAYLVGYGTNVPPVLSAFHRNTKTGTLKQLPGKSGCFSRDGSSEDGPNTCAKARNLGTGDATSIVISNDGRFLYVAAQDYQAPPGSGGIAVFKRNLKTGTLHQLKGEAGCVTATAYAGCAVAREVDDISNVHITPDQKYLYASNYGQSGIAVFKRNAKTGVLTQPQGANGCVTVDGTTAESGATKVCRAMPNISSPWDAATPDNRFVYVPASSGLSGPKLVQAFERNAKGGLVPLKGKGGCVSDTGTSPAGPCAKGHGLTIPERAVPSQNGRFLYIGNYSPSSPIVVLNRNPKTGSLFERSGPAACISVDGTTGDGIGSCRTGTGIDGEYAGALSPDGRTLYFSEYGRSSTTGGLTIFRVSPTTGAFSQLRGKFGCVTADGVSEKGAGTCQSARAVAGAYQVAIGGNNTVYVASEIDNGVALFHAAP